MEWIYPKAKANRYLSLAKMMQCYKQISKIPLTKMKSLNLKRKKPTVAIVEPAHAECGEGMGR